MAGFEKDDFRRLDSELKARKVKRKIAGLVEAMIFFGLEKGNIITLHQEDVYHVEGKEITLLPARKLLL
ncbi:hypothetical protein FW774_14595 [Pedobacter sp. BS3]|uniref:hypothetical protein n=1 Tax=Pedobacter sp. BS3 TaxID=2567937 RepID=UPI0011ED28D9|nr:hypothetical protein [Pedobacter sp. BS3]TZF82720.1 hypothetical protein FW774_14595 [Pedobacter sp. BS3]